MLAAYILSFIDRQIFSFLVGPIRETYQISDFQFSLLHGMAFAMFYTVLGLPLGRLADSRNRTLIIISGIVLWSMMTGLCGIAGSFAALFMARLGVGVGEATLSPAAYSLLSDLYSAKTLARAIAVFTLGITIGAGLAFVVGGAIYDFFERAGTIHLPLVGEAQPWQLTFLALAVPGIPLAGLMLCTVREPPRRNTLAGSTESTGLPVREVVAFMRQRKSVYGALVGSVSLMSVMGYATMAWYPEFLLRSYAMPKAEGGALFGSIFMFAGTAGTLAGAWMAQRLTAAGYEDAHLRLIMLAALALLLPSVAGPLMPTANAALLFAIPSIFLFYTHFGVAMTGLQLITPNEMRGQATAIMLFMTNLFGLGLGSTLVAALTDFVFADDQALYLSLSVAALLVYPLVAWVAWRGLSAYRAALDEAGHWQ